MIRWLLEFLLLVRTVSKPQPLFFAESSPRAQSLYVGCSEENKTRSANGMKLLGIGVQKGGTTSFFKEANKDGMCPGFMKELHYFDGSTFFQRDPTADDIHEYDVKWQGCPLGALPMDVTPNYFVVPSAARATCFLSPPPLIVILLRNPVDRAYSSFYENRRLRLPTTRDAHGFNALCTLDIQIATECPDALPTVDTYNANEFHEFRACCNKLALSFGYNDWPGCQCEDSSHCFPWGDKRAAVVRSGVYAHFLKFWLAYHPGDRIIIVKSEDFYKDVPGVAASIVDVATKISGIPLKRNLSTVFIQAKHNSETEVPMLEHTKKALQDFYTPHNEELERLLQLRFAWW